jgi:hypothetical protein
MQLLHLVIQSVKHTFYPLCRSMVSPWIPRRLHFIFKVVAERGLQSCQTIAVCIAYTCLIFLLSSHMGSGDVDRGEMGGVSSLNAAKALEPE